jgi:hypothetical protein
MTVLRSDLGSVTAKAIRDEDPIWPGPTEISLPRLLGQEPVQLRGYPMEMVLAEKIRNWSGPFTGYFARSERECVFSVCVAGADGRGAAAPERFYSHGMARVASLVVVACAVLVTACTAGQSLPVTAAAGTSPHSAAQVNGRSVPAGPPPVQGAAYVSGGCGTSPLLLGAAPGWASSANPPRIQYALAERGQVAGFLFGYPLMAGNPQPYSDKILWVVASSRDGMPLQLTGHLLGAAGPVVSSTWPADSEPGEIYPSEIVVPSPGCWQFTLSWNGHTDTVDLWYVRHR